MRSASTGKYIFAALLLASATNVGLVLMRILLTGEFRFLYLPGNLILAWLPLVFAFLAWLRYRQDKMNPLFYIYAFLWLAFMPNAPYIMTDLIHLSPRPPVPIWVDIVLIVSFAWTGSLLGFISVYLMQRIVTARLGRSAGWGFVIAVLGLAGLGIYIGRFLRWNSWDLVLSPLGVMGDVFMQFRHPRSNPAPMIYTILFTKWLFISYVLLYAVTLLRGVETQKTEARSSEVTQPF